MMYNADKLMSAFFFTGMPMHFGFFFSYRFRQISQMIHDINGIVRYNLYLTNTV